jgi:hypothetical protein
MYHFPLTDALPGTSWTRALDGSLVLVNLVTSGLFISFLIGAKNYFQENIKKKKDLQKQYNTKHDSVTEEPKKGKEEEKVKKLQKDVAKKGVAKKVTVSRFQLSRVFPF